MKKATFRIGKRIIGEGHSPLVIAEIGINHEGSLAKAKRMVRDAKASGAECVKFQSHVIEDEMVEAARKTVPGNTNVSIMDVMERCALTEKEEKELKRYVEAQGLIFLSTPFSRAAADRLHRMKVAWYKIGSGECNNYPLIEHIARFKKPVILSTGMNDIRSIAPAVKILRAHKVPFALLHCTSMYPTPYEKVRLGAMLDLKKHFPDAIVGLSDHTPDNYACIGATALGANILERHFTSDKTWPGPDIPISMDPSELADLVKGSRAVFLASGGKKEVLKEERPTIDFAYSCVVTIADIKPGEKFTEKNIWVKRPGTGEILAKDFKKVLGKRSASSIRSGEQLKRRDIAT